MDNIFNKVEAAIDNAMGSNASSYGSSRRENESPYGASGRQGDNTHNTSIYRPSHQHEAPATYAASRADVENPYDQGSYGSSGRNQDTSSAYGAPRRGYEDTYGSSAQQSSYGPGRQGQDDSYGSYRGNQGTHTYGSSGWDNEDTYRSSTKHSSYESRRNEEDSVRDTRGGCEREEGFFRRGDNEEPSRGYGGQEGWSVGERDDYYNESSSREHRFAQGSGGHGMTGGFGSYGEASSYAEKHAGSGRDGSMFSTAIGYLSGRGKNPEREDIDEGEFINSHREMYREDGGRGQKSSTSYGQAAAMQALKHFNNGSHSSGGDQNAFIGVAMAEAAKLFDSQSSRGNVVCYFFKLFDWRSH
jgi:hypothetical protein